MSTAEVKELFDDYRHELAEMFPEYVEAMEVLLELENKDNLTLKKVNRAPENYSNDFANDLSSRKYEEEVSDEEYDLENLSEPDEELLRKCGHDGKKNKPVSLKQEQDIDLISMNLKVQEKKANQLCLQCGEGHSLKWRLCEVCNDHHDGCCG